MNLIKPNTHIENLEKTGLLHDKMLGRRDFMKGGLAALLAGTVPLLGAADANAITNFASWRVNFRFYHTGESFSGVYRVGDRYLPEAFERMNYVLRDFRTGEAFPMDPRVLDILSMLQQKIGTSKSFDILSGYRSPKTNKMLSRASSGVARNSYHMYGQALDIRLPGYSTRKLRNNAKSLRAGGVGYYAKSGFVHVDTGDVRSW